MTDYKTKLACSYFLKKTVAGLDFADKKSLSLKGTEIKFISSSHGRQ